MLSSLQLLHLCLLSLPPAPHKLYHGVSEQNKYKWVPIPGLAQAVQFPAWTHSNLKTLEEEFRFCGFGSEYCLQNCFPTQNIFVTKGVIVIAVLIARNRAEISGTYVTGGLTHDTMTCRCCY